MATQTSVREEVWQGWIPVQVTIAPPETYIEYTYLLIAKRNAFLPVYTPKVVAYFKRYLAIDAGDDDWWYEFEGKPLPWSRPIGVLYDMLANKGSLWTLKIRSGADYPGSILPVSNDIFTDFWRNQFKEACYTRDGNANSVMNLARSKSHALFEAATNPEARFEDFWSIVDQLLRTEMLNIPLRIYKPHELAPLRKTVAAHEPDGEIRTLGTVLNLLLPEEFPSARSCSELTPFIHGASIEMSMPIDQIYKATMFCDGFLHVTLSTNSA